MQQRRVRLGDILDDYCPRERRVTNHAVVAMIDDEVKQTRCTTCDADHEYKEAKVPAPRRRKAGALTSDIDIGAPRAAAAPADDLASAEEAVDQVELADAFEQPDTLQEPEIPAEPEAAGAEAPPSDDQDEGPVHRPLIRATLPRPEGQTPERKAPEFTFRPGGGRFDQQRNGQRKRRPTRQGQFSGQGSRFGGPQGGSRQGTGQGQQRQGNRPGSGRPPRRGGSGRKRGR